MFPFCSDTEFPKIKQNVYMKNMEYCLEASYYKQSRDFKKKKKVSFTSI